MTQIIITKKKRQSRFGPVHVQHVVLEHGLVAEALAAQIADPEKRISNCFVKIILPKEYFCEGNNWVFLPRLWPLRIVYDGNVDLELVSRRALFAARRTNL